MKKLMLTLPPLFATLLALAQPSEKPRTIEVTGSAEKEIVPDEIYFTIGLREYEDGSRKVSLATLEKQLRAAVQQAGLSQDQLRVSDNRGYQWQRRDQPTRAFLASRQYVLELTDVAPIGKVLEGVDARGIQHTDITRYSHSKIEAYRQEVKIAAVRAAREKANYLLAALDEQRGAVLEIQELDGHQPRPMYREAFANVAMASDAGAAPVDFQKIKLTYRIRVVFAIK